ncbi:MAG: hypothetical protein ACQCN4_02805 [Candidatus Bathyarchaeia archaeon]|jgi:hypothetical protein
MLKIPIAQIFDCQLDREAYAFIAQYPNMVTWWIKRSQEFKEGSFSTFRNQFYDSWKKDWVGYNSQHAQTSSLVAYSALNLSKKKPQTNPIELKWNFAVISPRIAKIEDETIVFPTKLTKKAHVKLIAKNSREKVLLEQAQNEHWQIGQSFLTPEWCAVPFTRFIDLTIERDRYLRDLLK